MPRIGDIVTVSIGFYFYPVGDPNYPAGEIQFSETEKPGFYQGYRLAQGSPYTHLTPKLYWLNQKPEIIDSECGGIVRGQPQVLINKARASRSKWRHKAFIDAQGRPFNDRFICFRPQRNVSLNTLWAIVNSPLANAFTFAESPRADFSPVRLGRMPFPVLRKGDTKALDEAVDSYFEAARRFSIRFAEQERKRPGKNRTVTPPADEALELPLEDESQNQRDDIAAARETLRALHWRVDAEVLKLYSLPAALERELLDFFDGVHRIGVPFEQTAYIPSRFREANRLDDYLRITDEWEQTDDRRCQLVEKQFRGGGRNAKENAEFAELQRLYGLRRSYRRWQRTGDANHPLIDEAALRRVQEEDARRDQRK